MPEYIEREEVMKTARDGYHSDFGRSMADLTSLRELLEDTPAADVTEVVRCSECKYFGKELKQGKHNCLNYQLPYCLENDYCSYGERKDGEEHGL